MFAASFQHWRNIFQALKKMFKLGFTHHQIKYLYFLQGQEKKNYRDLTTLFSGDNPESVMSFLFNKHVSFTLTSVSLAAQPFLNKDSRFQVKQVSCDEPIRRFHSSNMQVQSCQH